MLAQRPDMIVEVIKDSSTDQKVIIDWQLLAYSSAAGPRSDFPDNVDHVDDAYCSPLYSEQLLIATAEMPGSAEVPNDPNHQESWYEPGMEDSNWRNCPDLNQHSSG